MRRLRKGRFWSLKFIIGPDGGPDEFGKCYKLIGGEDGASAGIMHCARWSLVVLPPPQQSSSAIFLGGCRPALKALCLRASIPGRDARLLTACAGPGAYAPRGCWAPA